MSVGLVGEGREIFRFLERNFLINTQQRLYPNKFVFWICMHVLSEMFPWIFPNPTAHRVHCTPFLPQIVASLYSTLMNILVLYTVLVSELEGLLIQVYAYTYKVSLTQTPAHDLARGAFSSLPNAKFLWYLSSSGKQMFLDWLEP